MGYKGVSFPLQLSKRGGILLSDTTADAPTHLSQALEQLLNTKKYDRIMEVAHYCDISRTLFENSESAKTMIKDIIVEAVENLEQRVAIEDDDIELTITEDGIHAEITYTVLDLGIQETVPILIGGIDNIG